MRPVQSHTLSHCCGSASHDADPDSTYNPVEDPDADPDSDFNLMRIRHFFLPDPTFHSDADTDLNFYLMRIRIQITKMMRIDSRIRVHNTALTWIRIPDSNTMRKK